MFRTRRAAANRFLRSFSTTTKTFRQRVEEKITFQTYCYGGLFTIFAFLVADNLIRKRVFTGKVSQDLIRRKETPRENYEQQVVEDGLTFYNLQGLVNPDTDDVYEYWNERASIQISPKAEKELMEATFELHNMCLEVVDRVVRDDVLLEQFEIPVSLWPIIKRSWEEKQPDLMGRFDFSWNGVDPPKLLEYNADTPSVFVESGHAQLNWQKMKHPEAYQCNLVLGAYREGIEKIAKRYGISLYSQTLGFCMVQQDAESQATAKYLARLANTQGLVTKVADVGELEFAYIFGELKDEVEVKLEGTPIKAFVKLYPLEWLIQEASRPSLFSQDLEEVNMIEPAWKLILGNKGILALLWEMYPNHPNLLPAYFINPEVQLAKNAEDDKQDTFKKNYDDLDIKDWVSKPKFGREGEDVKLSKSFSSYDDFVKATDRQTRYKTYPDGSKVLMGRSIYQKFFPLPYANSRTILTSSWVINGQPAGLCFREDYDEVSNNNSEFLPHYVYPVPSTRKWNFKLSPIQISFRNALYGANINENLYKDLRPPLEVFQDFTGVEANVRHCTCGGGCASYRSAGVRHYRHHRENQDYLDMKRGQRKYSQEQLRNKRRTLVKKQMTRLQDNMKRSKIAVATNTGTERARTGKFGSHGRRSLG